MKGIVFTEFMEMVEDKFSPELLDTIITESDLPSGGVYTAVGTYSHTEVVSLVSNLSKRSGIPVPDLLRAFGKHLFVRFLALYPQFFEGIESSFAFMRKVDDYIHVEVRKLYPDAELPRIFCEAPNPQTLIVLYQSVRPMADLAEGLISGCTEHFNDCSSTLREDVQPGTMARFTLTARQ